MNNTITLSQLITRLAKATGVDNNTARHFLRTFFATIEDTLENGESVTVKNIGTFRLSDNDPSGRRKLAFVPDENLRSEINKPFEMFEAVELADGVDFPDEPDHTAETQAAEEPAPAEVQQPATMPEKVVEEVIEEPVTVVESVPEPVVETQEPELQPEAVAEPEPVSAPTAKITEDVDGPVYHFADDDEEEEQESEPKPRERVRSEGPRTRGGKSIWIWCILIVLVCVGAGLAAAIYSVPIPDLYEDEPEETAVADTAASVAIEEVGVEDIASATDEAVTAKPENKTAVSEPTTVPAPSKPASAIQQESKKVYDTVEVSLIRLAKKHYGVSEFWVYIFDANRDKISNPNTIRPGTRVLIPDRAGFPGSTLKEAKDLAKAKQAEYQRKYSR